MSTIEFSFPFFWKLNIQVYHELTVIASHCIYIHFFLCMLDTLQHRFCIVNFYIQTYFLLIIEVLNSMIHDAENQFTINLFRLMYTICKQKHPSYRLNHCSKLQSNVKNVFIAQFWFWNVLYTNLYIFGHLYDFIFSKFPLSNNKAHHIHK